MAFLLQSASNTSVLTSVAATFGATPIQSNLLIAAVTADIGVGSISITGWSTGKSIANGVAGGLIVFYKVAGIGESRTVTASGTLATFMDIQIFEYDGIDNASPLDVTASTADDTTSVTSRSSGSSGTLTQAIELAFAAVAQAGSNGGGASWTNSYTARITTTHLITADLTTAATTATSSTGSWTTTQRAAGVILTFFGETGVTESSGGSSGIKNLKPRIPVIEWSNPLTKDLIFAMPCFERGLTGSALSIQELVFRNIGTIGGATGNPTGVTSNIGNMLNFTGANPGPAVDVALNSQQRSLAQFTVCLFASRQGAAPSNNGRMFCITDGSTTGVNFIDVDNTNTLQLNVNFSTTRGIWSVSKNTAQSLNFWVVTYDGSSVSNVPSIYCNGIPLTVTTSTPPVGNQTFNDTDILLGNLNQTGNVFTRTYNGYLSDLYMWKRILNIQEVELLSTNPWQIYNQPQLIKKPLV